MPTAAAANNLLPENLSLCPREKWGRPESLEDPTMKVSETNALDRGCPRVGSVAGPSVDLLPCSSRTHEWGHPDSFWK